MIAQPSAAGDVLTTSFSWEMMRCLTTSVAREVERDRDEGYLDLLPMPFGELLPDGRRERFLLRRLIGRGSHGEVFEAVDRLLSPEDGEAVVAIKMMADESHAPAPVHEAQRGWRIRHPNVAVMYEIGFTTDGDGYLVMEYVPGGTLLDLIRTAPLPWDARRAAEFVARVARGVLAVHQAGLIHCDLKPQNILLSDAGEPKISDFGISTTHGVAPARLGESARAGGCMAFMAPEQYRGAPTQQSDLFALGGLLYWLLTARLPWGSTMDEIEAQHRDPADRWLVPSPRAINPAVPHDLERICRKALSPTLAGRHHSASQLIDDLGAFLERRPLVSMHSGPARVAALWFRRRPVTAALTTMAAAGALVGALLIGSLQGRLKEEQQYRATIGQSAKLMGDSYTKWQGRSNEQLQILWFSEWIFGPRVFDNPGAGDVWGKRIDVIRRAAAGAQRPSIEAAMTDLALAYWVTRDGRHAEAATMVGPLRADLAALTAPGDALFLIVDAIDLTARAQAAVEAGDRAAADVVSTQIEALFPRLDASIDARPAQLMLCEALVLLYGEGALDRGPDLDRVRGVQAGLLASIEAAEPPT